MKFAMFFMAEYANMITVACLASLLFLGGWHGPLFGPPLLQAILPVFWFGLRVFMFLFIYIWVRGTLPRFRYDQLMAFGWKFLLPLAIANLGVTAVGGVVREWARFWDLGIFLFGDRKTKLRPFFSFFNYQIIQLPHFTIFFFFSVFIFLF